MKHFYRQTDPGKKWSEKPIRAFSSGELIKNEHLQTPLPYMENISQSTILSKTFLRSRCCQVWRDYMELFLLYGKFRYNIYKVNWWNTIHACQPCFNWSGEWKLWLKNYIVSHCLAPTYRYLLKSYMTKTYLEWGLQMLPPYWDLKYPCGQGLTVPAIKRESVREISQYL